MPESFTLPLLGVGAALLLVGVVWLLVVAFRTGFFVKALVPVVVILAGVVVGVFIPAYNRIFPTPADTTAKPEQKKTADGGTEERLTLTGARREEYAKLAGKRFTVVQWANADVTDDDTAALAGQPELRELDLNGTQVTDATLERVVKLPKLAKLFIARTKITPAAVAKWVLDNPDSKVSEIDVTGLNVPGKAVRDWKAADTSRKANQ